MLEGIPFHHRGMEGAQVTEGVHGTQLLKIAIAAHDRCPDKPVGYSFSVLGMGIRSWKAAMPPTKKSLY